MKEDGICTFMLSSGSLDDAHASYAAGGGHAFIGLYLAKQLLSDGHSVTILNDGSKVIRTMPTLTWRIKSRLLHVS